MVCLNVGFNSWRIVFLNSDSNWNQELTVDPKQNLEKETVMTGQPTPPPKRTPLRNKGLKFKKALLREINGWLVNLTMTTKLLSTCKSPLNRSQRPKNQ